MFGQADDVQPFARIDARIGVGEHEQFAAARGDFLQVALSFSMSVSFGATTTGMGSGTSASGPCLSSPAG